MRNHRRVVSLSPFLMALLPRRVKLLPSASPLWPLLMALSTGSAKPKYRRPINDNNTRSTDYPEDPAECLLLMSTLVVLWGIQLKGHELEGWWWCRELQLWGICTLMLYLLVLLICLWFYFFCFCFDLGFYLPWDISRMQQLSPRKC